MALFFNQDWFAARMRAHHLTPDTVARALGLSAAQWRAVTRDQRELRPREVQALAQLLGASPQEIATEAGIGTARPPALPPPVEARFRALEARVAALERAQKTSSASAPKRPGRRTRR